MLSKRNKFSFKHECDLPLEDVDDIQRLSPFDSPFQRWYSRTRNNFTVYKSKESGEYFRSNAALLAEQRRHLRNPRYKYVIHPFSKFKCYRSSMVCTIWGGLLLAEFYFGGFYPGFYSAKNDFKFELIIKSVVLFLNFLLMVDMVLRFFVGYTIPQTRQVILEPIQIAKTYLSTYFFFDFGAIVSYFFFFFVPMSTTASILVFNLHILRLVRIISLNHQIVRCLIALNLTVSLRFAVQLLVTYSLILHLWTCIFGLVALVRTSSVNFEIFKNSLFGDILVKNQDYLDTLPNRLHLRNFWAYTQILTVVISHFSGSGVGPYTTRDTIEMFLLSGITMTGLAMYLYATVRILDVFGIVNISETKYEEFSLQVGNYMSKKRFNKNLKKRIQQYYDFKYNRRFFSERTIISTLTDHLYMEILLYSCQNLVSHVEAFKGLPKPAVGSILALLKREIYVSGEVITRSDIKDGSIYLILYGTCAVRKKSGREALHIEDGDLFGDTQNLDPDVNLQDNYAVVALETTEIYKLEKEDVRYCIKTYPEILKKLQEMVKRQTKIFNAMLAIDSNEYVSSDDIVEDLRKGKILEHARLRYENN